MVVLGVDLEMLGEVIDALCEERDLDFRRSRVAVVSLVRADDAGLTILGKRHAGFLHVRSRTLMRAVEED
jgi:hypothetical protein